MERLIPRSTRGRMLVLSMSVAIALVATNEWTADLLIHDRVKDPGALEGITILAALAVLALVTWLTLRFTDWALTPVAQMRTDIVGSGEKELNRRVRVPDTGDEVQYLAEAINTMSGQLQSVVQRERRFVSDASHDLRNPIAGLTTRLEVALQDPEDDHIETMRALLRDVLRLSELVNDLLELTRLDAATEATLDAVDLSRLVTEELARRTRALTVTTDLQPGAIVLASRVRLARVLNNLLANTERHAHNVRVVVTVHPPDTFLEVIDDGPGIPRPEWEHVFERFVRLDDSRRQDPGGTGLGLPISRQIAHMYGGDLYLAEHPTGARFVLRLPLAA